MTLRTDIDALPVNVDTTYADDAGDASVKLHQQHHDTLHAAIKKTSGPHVIYPSDYGAKGDGVIGSTGAMTSGSATLTDANAAFTSADVGKSIVINGSGASGVSQAGTISAFTDATHVTLSFSASTTVSSAGYAYGTDDTAAIQSAITAANSPSLQSARTVIQFEALVYIIAGALVQTSGYNSQLNLPIRAKTVAKATIEFVGVPGNAVLDGPWAPQGSPQAGGTVLVSTIVSVASFSTTHGVPSIIGGPASNGTTGQAFTNVNFVSRGIVYRQCRLPQLFDLDLGWVSQTTLYGRSDVLGDPAMTVLPGTQSGGILMPQVNNNGFQTIESWVVYGRYWGLVPGEHTTVIGVMWVSFAAVACAFGITDWFHGATIKKLSTQSCVYDFGQFSMASGSGQAASTACFLKVDLFDPQDDTTGAFAKTESIHDTAGKFIIEATFVRVVAGTGVVNSLKISSGIRGCRMIDLAQAHGNTVAITTPSSASSSLVLYSSGGASGLPVFRDCVLYITGGTVTGVAVDGTTVATATPATIIVPAGRAFTLTYSVAPTIVAVPL